MKRSFLAAAAALSLAACGGGGTGSGPGPVAGVTSSAGFLAAAINDPTLTGSTGATFEQIGGQIKIDGGGGATFSGTVDTVSGVAFTTDLLPMTKALEAPSKGTATMTGNWALSHVTDAEENAGVWSGNLSGDAGTLSLTADFGAGTLAGGGDGLTVAGTISDDALGGNVSYGGLSGNLAGIIGGGSVVGLFTATGTGEGYGGAFVAAAN